MMRQTDVDSSTWLYWLGPTLLSGSIISGAMSTDKRWMNWHFSRLGEGGTTSALIFNITLLIAAGLIYLFSKSLTNNISKVKTASDDVVRLANRRLGNLFVAIALCIVVVSLFPFDKFPVIHNIFGYSMLFIFVYMCMNIANILPIFNKNFLRLGQFIIGIAIFCYILFLGFAAITLLVVEAILFLFLYVWLLLLAKEVKSAVVADKLRK